MDTWGIKDCHLREKYIEATRHRLYSGAGIATASVIGCTGAVVLELTLAMVLFGLAIPILVYQIRREYYRLQYLERRTP